MNIPVRLPKSIEGLKKMVAWINGKENTNKLTLLEIGSWAGTSAAVFANEFKEVVCVDPWEPTEEINTIYNMSDVEKLFDENTAIFNNVIKIKRRSEDYIKETVKKYDVIYIDGIHSYEGAKRDIENYLPITKKYICGHDWADKFPGVKQAVKEMIGEPDAIFPDSSWIKKIGG